jgi:hypothetical protein
MNTETEAHPAAAEETRPAAPPREVSGKSRPPDPFVYDNGQILLELLRGRAEEEERRRFVAGLRRLDRGGLTPDAL